jgi:hypothetical protein
MKKLRLLFKLLASVLVIFVMQGCPKSDSNECITCKYDDGDKFTVCEDDKSDWEDYADSWDEVKDYLNDWDDEDSDISCN